MVDFVVTIVRQIPFYGGFSYYFKKIVVSQMLYL